MLIFQIIFLFGILGSYLLKFLLAFVSLRFLKKIWMLTQVSIETDRWLRGKTIQSSIGRINISVTWSNT